MTICELCENNVSRKMRSSLVTIVFMVTVSCTIGYKQTIDFSSKATPIQKFWRSTGFSPDYSDASFTKEYFQSKDVYYNLVHIASLPKRGIEYVRIHWLLSVLQVDENGFFDFAEVDAIIGKIMSVRLKPIFEIMGNSTVLINRKHEGYSFWKLLATHIAYRYMIIYSQKEVLTWIFETWNEPDLKMYNALNFTLKEYLDYVDGITDGLKEVHPRVQIGGPAGLFKNNNTHPLCWGFLKHCNNSPTRCKISYISFHKKGNGTVSELVRGSRKLINHIQKNFNNLTHLPLVNDESDILSGWWKSEEWRGDVRYAAVVIRTISIFRKFVHRGIIERISFDNGFIAGPPDIFDLRTLHARFTEPSGYSAFVQKPIFGAMGLLAMLDDGEIFLCRKSSGRKFITASKTEENDKMLSGSVLIGVSTDNMEINSTAVRVKLKLIMEEPAQFARFAIYMLDNDLPHPKKIWEAEGRPLRPTKELLKKLLSVQEPHRMKEGMLKQDTVKMSLRLSVPSVAFIHICFHGVSSPGKVTELKVMNITFNEVLLSWKEPPEKARCIKTYQIENCLWRRKGCQRVNENDFIFNSYHYIYLPSVEDEENDTDEKTRGFYRVVAVDYWGRKGVYSDTVIYGDPDVYNDVVDDVDDLIINSST